MTDALAPSPRVVEVGVGGRFATLRAVRRRRPEADLLAVDVDPRALEGAPEGVATRVDDVHDPSPTIYRGSDLVLAVRPPVEMQRALAELARANGSALAMRALKDEWADLADVLGEPVLPEGPEPWRLWLAPERGDGQRACGKV